MKKISRISLLLAFCALGTPGSAQFLVWAKQFSSRDGGECGSSLATDADGHIYTVGNFETLTDFDPGPGSFLLNCTSSFGSCFISKLDASGNFLWAKVLAEGGAENRALSNIVDAEGNILITGDFMGTVDFDPGTATAFLTGTGGSSDIFVCKMDSSGNLLWVKSMGGPGQDAGIHIKVDHEGNVLSTGYFLAEADLDPGPAIHILNHAGSYDFYVSKLDASGAFVWAKGFGGSGVDQGTQLITGKSGEVYVTGAFSGQVDFDPGTGEYPLTSAGDRDVFILKLDASGNFEWARQMGGANRDIGEGITLDDNGTIFISGSFLGDADFDPGAGTHTMNSAGDADVFISALDPDGNFKWAKQMGGTYTDETYSIIAHENRIYTLGIFTDSVDFNPGIGIYKLGSAGLTDAFLSTLDLSGNFVSAIRTGGDLKDIPTSLALSGNGAIHATGCFYGTADFDPGPRITNLISAGGADAFVVKFTKIQTGINAFEEPVQKVLLFPNPATDALNIFSSVPDVETLEIFNIHGERVVAQAHGSKSENQTLDVSPLPPGIYYARMQTSAGAAIGRFVKE